MKVPPGDRILLGKTTRDGARTYLVKGAPVLDARGVVGAMANERTADEWEVGFTFTPEAAESLVRAMSEEGTRFRIVVHGLVEQDRFELVDVHSSAAIAGPHGALSTSDWVCSEHPAVLGMSARADVTAKARAERLASAFPPFRGSGTQCSVERWMPRPAPAPAPAPAPDASDAPALSVAAFLAQKPSSGRFTVEGFLQAPRHCPPCPPNAWCKPCEDTVFLSDARGAYKGPIADGVDLRIVVPDATRFVLLHRYRMTVDVRANGHPVLRDSREVAP